MTPTTLTKDGSKTVVIDPDELMIGNLLEYKGKIVHVTTLTLDIDDEYQESIGFCELGKSTDEICDWNRSLADGLKPIIITSQLLIKLGFIPKMINGQRGNDGKWWIEQKTGIQALFEFDIRKETFFWEILGQKVEFLHELQNYWKVIVKQKLAIATSNFDKPL